MIGDVFVLGAPLHSCVRHRWRPELGLTLVTPTKVGAPFTSRKYHLLSSST